MNGLFKIARHDTLSIANILGTNASGSVLSRRLVGFHVRSCLERFTKLATNTRAHNVVSAGTVIGEAFLVDNAEDEGMLFCAEGESASDASPNAGGPVRCLLLLGCLDMSNRVHLITPSHYSKSFQVVCRC
jgi:hypothetical protein